MFNRAPWEQNSYGQFGHLVIASRMRLSIVVILQEVYMEVVDIDIQKAASLGQLHEAGPSVRGGTETLQTYVAILAGSYNIFIVG